MQFPEFLDCVERIVGEFREIHDRSRSEHPLTAPFEVGVLNAWGRLRTWQTYMVAHALWYRQTYSYLGVIEALAGLPFNVRFLSFDDIADGVPDSIGVLVNAGAAGTAFSGGARWADVGVQSAVRRFVAGGGGFIGVGDPTAAPGQGAYFQLSDILGVDREVGWSLSTRHYPTMVENHFIAADLGTFDAGESTPGIIPMGADTDVIRVDAGGDVTLAAHAYGTGRAVYAAGLPWSTDNNRVLHRAIHWAAGDEAGFGEWAADDPRVEIARYTTGVVLVYSMARERVDTTVRGNGKAWTVTLAPGGHAWLS